MLNNKKTYAFGIIADDRDVANIKHRAVNLWLVISGKAPKMVIGMTPLSKIL